MVDTKSTKWEYNKQRNAIVSPSESNIENNSSDDEFYGGKLICESVWDKDVANIITAAPDMLETLINLKTYIDLDDEFKSMWSESLDKVIKKATS